ncbi:MAG: GPW/gp25 family protein [Selenomonadaceae bacterium]|nr:GPW/gp25 family protein [Selenomonadaceae bacterium]
MQVEIKMLGEINLMPASELEEIYQNVRTIVTTVKGTVPLDRELGISANILDAPMNQQSRLIAEVAEAIEKFEPRARLRRIEFTGNENGELNPTLTLEIRD